MAKILVIDDNRDLLEMMEMFLLGKGHNVETATNEISGLQKIKDHAPDIIILDVRLGDHSGRDLCIEIKRSYKNIPVILMSAFPELLFDYLLCGADDKLAKPFEVKDLLTKINKLLLI